MLCPVCRAGPKGQRLSVRRLPREWRYSLAARVRRQKYNDRIEAVEDDRQVAMQMASNQIPRPIILTMSPMFIHIRIEIMSRINLNDLDTPLPMTWTTTTTPVRLAGAIVFDVPPNELRHIPYPNGTTMRIVPHINPLVQPLRPSQWFVTGTNTFIGENFSVHCDERGFHHIHYSLSNTAYEELILETFMAYDVLVAVPED